MTTQEITDTASRQLQDAEHSIRAALDKIAGLPAAEVQRQAAHEAELRKLRERIAWHEGELQKAQRAVEEAKEGAKRALHEAPGLLRRAEEAEARVAQFQKLFAGGGAAPAPVQNVELPVLNASGTGVMR